MRLTYAQAKQKTGLSKRTLIRQFAAANIPRTSNCQGVLEFELEAFQVWWAAYQGQRPIRVINLGPFRRRAANAEGRQVCPGIKYPCGASLPRTARGRQARLCEKHQQAWATEKTARRLAAARQAQLDRWGAERKSG